MMQEVDHFKLAFIKKNYEGVVCMMCDPHQFYQRSGDGRIVTIMPGRVCL
jgi:hypothetical protein